MKVHDKGNGNYWVEPSASHRQTTPFITFGSDVGLYRSGADSYVIVGRPTLRALLRYWWRNGRRP